MIYLRCHISGIDLCHEIHEGMISLIVLIVGVLSVHDNIVVDSESIFSKSTLSVSL